ncbi:hypothetical protein P7K49_015056 [Saguinus oedipus]|uniref:Uncharacterized protein n=1 Tax=Saguinus oedipus TaxID=9490 RepID=A0ABQ9V854_SAGOE|nr:hypothetical protein P7K49_015056 [Saguinus oedipus]
MRASSACRHDSDFQNFWLGSDSKDGRAQGTTECLLRGLMICLKVISSMFTVGEWQAQERTSDQIREQKKTSQKPGGQETKERASQWEAPGFTSFQVTQSAAESQRVASVPSLPAGAPH